MAVFPSMIFKKTKGLLPAAERILNVAAESTQVNFDAASDIESRGFCDLLMTPSAKNLIRTMFVQMGEIASGASRPAVDGKSRITRSEEHTSELQSLMRISYAVFCLTQKNNHRHAYKH